MADLKNVNLAKACLVGANLAGADLSEGVFVGVDFTESPLTGTRFQRADLRQSIFPEPHRDLANSQPIKPVALEFEE